MTTPPPFPAPAVFSPLAEQQRCTLLDAVRGFALFGIFQVNLLGFKVPALQGGTSYDPWHHEPGNVVGLLALEAFFAGKFVTLFALMFGLGMAMQYRRAETVGRPFYSFFSRRMIVLFLLGVFHGIFLWSGDILAPYALMGLVALLFLRCRPKTLFVWSAATAVVAALWFSGVLSFALWAADNPEPDETWDRFTEWSAQTYLHGGFVEMTQVRAAEWLLAWLIGVFSYFPYVFSLLLLGLGLGKLDVLGRLEVWMPRLPRLAAFAGIGGLFFAALYMREFYRSEETWSSYLVSGASHFLTMPLLALCYLLLLILMVEGRRFPGLTDRLAAVGRLSLTHYLLQSVVANVLFMGWGFGLCGDLTAPEGMVIGLLVFVGQMAVSPLWLRHFRLGPAEWLWRRLSYGTPFPLRRIAPD